MWAIELGAPHGGRRRAVWSAIERAQTRPRRAAARRAAVRAPPDLLPGRRPPHERRQGAAGARRRGGGDPPLRRGARGRRRRRRPHGRRRRRASAGTSRAAALARCAGEGARHRRRRLHRLARRRGARRAPAPQVRAFDRREPRAPARRAPTSRPATCSTATRCAARSTARRGLPPRRALQLRARATRRRWSASTSRGRARCSRRRGRGASSTRPPARPAARSRGARRPRATARRLGAARPLQAHQARRRAPRARRRGARRRRRRREPDDAGRARRPPPDADRQDGRRRRRRPRPRLPRRSALNIVAVEDVARGHVLAFERGRAGRRYLLGGENLSMREVFAAICAAVGRAAAARRGALERSPTAPRWSPRALRPSRTLLVLDEVRVARWPMRFDDARARASSATRRSRRSRRWRAPRARRAATAAALLVRGPAPGALELLPRERLALAVGLALRARAARRSARSPRRASTAHEDGADRLDAGAVELQQDEAGDRRQPARTTIQRRRGIGRSAPSAVRSARRDRRLIARIRSAAGDLRRRLAAPGSRPAARSSAAANASARDGSAVGCFASAVLDDDVERRRHRRASARRRSGGGVVKVSCDASASAPAGNGTRPVSAS